MLLQVDGWFGSGKGVLYTLLDGHPDVFCSPVHDYSYAAFLGQSNDLDWIQTKHTEILRKALARTQYFKFEKVYWDGFMSFDFAAGKVLKIPYSLDYYQFDREFFKAMVEKDTWTLEDMIDTLYGSVFMAAKGKESFDGKALWFASPSNALFVDEYENIPQIFPNGKSIQVRRSVEKIIATRSNRKPRPEDFKTWSFFCDKFEKRIEEGEVEKILSYYDKYDRLVDAYPEQFMIIDFNELVVDTENAMKKVAEFLSIPFHSSFLMASYNGEELICEGKKYIGEELDDINTLLTPEERAIIRERVDQYYSTRKK